MFIMWNFFLVKANAWVKMEHENSVQNSDIFTMREEKEPDVW